MQRRNVLIAMGALVVLALGGFGAAHFLTAKSPPDATLVAAKPSTCDDAYRVLKLRPSMITAARPFCLVQSLVFSGELHGLVGQAYPVQADGVAATAMCSVPKRWDTFPQAVLVLVVGGNAYRLRITPPGSSEHQSVTLRNLQGALDLASIADPKADWSQASGTVVVNPNGVSGTVDADVQRDVAGVRPVHISGKWACGAPVAAASDPSVPCSLFFSLNQLQDPDVARIKQAGCVAEDLTFSGAISGHLDHAVNDPAYAQAVTNYGDNNCGDFGGNYTGVYNGTLKFALGDESFLLDLYQRATTAGAVGPGQYQTGSGPFSSNAFLWLGQADPAHNGVFITDDKVYWYASTGSFTISSDLKSGTIDENFTGMFEHSSSTVHVVGNWRCA